MTGSYFFQALLHRSARVAGAGRAWLAARSGVQIGSRVHIGASCEVMLGPAPARRGRIVFGDRTSIARGVLLHPYGGTIAIGADVYIGPYTTVYGQGGVTVGKDTLISMGCRILSSNHTVPSDRTIIRSQPDLPLPVTIGCDVWLGANTIVLGGVNIGDGCVVGAGAVVTDDLPPYSIALGVPSRVVRRRLAL